MAHYCCYIGQGGIVELNNPPALILRHPSLAEGKKKTVVIDFIISFRKYSTTIMNL